MKIDGQFFEFECAGGPERWRYEDVISWEQGPQRSIILTIQGRESTIWISEKEARMFFDAYGKGKLDPYGKRCKQTSSGIRSKA